MEPLFYAVLVRLSPGYSPLIGRLHTRYSPVRRSPPMYCYIVLPLDLHVLSLSLAFILSQDQTLRCLNCFLSLCSEFVFIFKFLTVLIFNTCTTCWYVNLSKNSCCYTRFILANVDAKIRTFIPYFQIFQKVFSKSFFHHVLQCRSLSNADAKVVLYNIRSKLLWDYFLN